MHDLPVLKQRLLIPEVWQRLGLPGRPAPSCRSPFRADTSPSFSLYAQGRRWKDFASGDGGDAIDFIARACGIALEEATRRFLAMAGVVLPLPLTRTPKADKAVLTLPRTHRGTPAEIAAIAHSRRLLPEAVSLAQSMQTLWLGDSCGFPCWILTDAARKIAEARRVDGRPFPPIGTLGERKAHTLKGSCKAWPVGVAVLKRLPHVRAIMLVEGGPDYLAALHFCLAKDVYDLLPIAMLGRGAGNRLDPLALKLLSKRRVRIYPHADADGGGLTSARIWAAQLHAAGCDVDLFSFEVLARSEGPPIKDLNDAARIQPTPTQQPQLDALLP
ncbi:MAG: hypothetical protein U0984_14375 [Prosthecobacter sp.]|nr:hypothetical protein [Prosthecobacter sp.]